MKSPRLENEIEHGKYLLRHGPERKWNWESPAGRMRWMRRAQLLARDLAPGMTVLEVGCGTGHFSRHLALERASITAVDLSPDLIEAARMSSAVGNLHFAVEDAHALTFGDAAFACVVGSSVLHHLDIELALPEIYRVLKPNGFIRFVEPNMLNPQIAIQKNVPAVARWLGDSPDETAFFRWSLRRRLKRTGFREVRVEPFDFLHPALPAGWIPAARKLGDVLERLPVLREIAGSLYIRALK